MPPRLWGRAEVGGAEEHPQGQQGRGDETGDAGVVGEAHEFLFRTAGRLGGGEVR
jgi:hypothetical protein